MYLYTLDDVKDTQFNLPILQLSFEQILSFAKYLHQCNGMNYFLSKKSQIHFRNISNVYEGACKTYNFL